MRSDYVSNPVSFWAGSQFPAPPSSGPPTSGLKLWLKGDAGVTLSAGTVTAWADQSGNGNDVTPISAAPTFVASAINGKPGIDASSGSMQNTTSNLVTGGADRTMCMVCKPTAGVGAWPEGGTAFSFRLAGTQMQVDYATFSTDTYGYSDGVALTTKLSTPVVILNTPSLIEFSGKTGDQPLYVINGVKHVLDSGAIVTETGTTGFCVGNSASSVTLFFAGLICEVLVYDHTLSAGEATSLRSYVRNKYAIG